MKRTLTGYVVSEILPPFLLGLAAFTLILLVARILRLVELVVTRGVGFLEIGKLFGLVLPTFLEMTVPMALLLAIFLGLGRLSSDHELLALKASGISPTQVLLPIATLALFISLLTLLLTTLVRPAANLALKKELYEIAKSRVGTALREKVFNDDFPLVLIYLDEMVPPGDTTQGVLIVDRRNQARENIIFSKVALIQSDEESKTIGLKLFDGAVYEREKKRPSFSQTRFNTYDLRLDLEDAFSPIRKKERGPKEMSLRRLGKAIQLKEDKGVRPTAELIELHQRFSFAFAPLVLSLLGVSLVMVPTRTRASRSWGFAFCLIWLLVYYGLLSVGKALGERELLPPALALWLPNIVVGLVALRLFQKALRESPFLIQSRLEDFSLQLNRRLARYMQRD